VYTKLEESERNDGRRKKDVGGGGEGVVALLARSEWVAVGDVENTKGAKKTSQSHVTLVTPRDLASHSVLRLRQLKKTVHSA
jgi:hypothetical protein